ncbi:MAG TPA: SDR family oxidoreductase [Parasegetibacter sp.]
MSKKQIPKVPQTQERPGIEEKMIPVPVSSDDGYEGTGKLEGKKVLITGGDSGIGRAVAVLFAREGADIAIMYLNEEIDAKETARQVKDLGRQCVLIPGDIRDEQFCNTAITNLAKKWKHIDILINNAAIHYQCENLEEIDTNRMRETFEVNIYSMIWITKFTLPFMKEGGSIINSSSVTAYRGSSSLIDYAATKGAIVSFTRSLATNLIKRKIRVNGVAPGPIWTPLIASSFDPERVASHGASSPMGRPGEPVEVAPSYLFLACNEMSSYITGQFLHPNGGEIINT